MGQEATCPRCKRSVQIPDGVSERAVLHCACGQMFLRSGALVPGQASEITPPAQVESAYQPDAVPPTLGKCRECGAPMHSSAKACPRCGARPLLQQLPGAFFGCGCLAILAGILVPILLLGGC